MISHENEYLHSPSLIQHFWYSDVINLPGAIRWRVLLANLTPLGERDDRTAKYSFPSVIRADLPCDIDLPDQCRIRRINVADLPQNEH